MAAYLGVSSSSSREEKVAPRREYGSARIASGRHLLALYPGEAVRLILRVHGPVGRVVLLEEQGFPRSVASLEIAPRQARAPYQAVVTVTANPYAAPGVYPWRLRVVEDGAGDVLGEEFITLVILPENLPKKTAGRVANLRKLYTRYGIQVALWAALKQLYPEGAPFAALRSLYELLTGRRVSKGTVGNTLRTMLQKGLLDKTGSIYKALDLDFEVVLTRVDVKRVRYPWQVLRNRGRQRESRDSMLKRYKFGLTELPQPVRRAYTLAKRIAERHGPLAALYFLLHSLMGVRQTGHLLLWFNGWFIVLEPKTGFAHHFYSWLLHWILQQLGLREGVYYKPNDKEHSEARRIAQKFIRKIYGSHQVARRLHYMLWERNLAWSDEEVYTVKVYHYLDDNDVGIRIQNKAGREELYSENLRDGPARTEVYTALPIRHVDKRNEETYFHRPAGIY